MGKEILTILAKNKSIGLEIQHQYIPTTDKKFYIIDQVNIGFYAKTNPFSCYIEFKKEEFFRYCKLLEDTQSMVNFPEWFRGWEEVMAYREISYSGENDAVFGVFGSKKENLSTAEAQKIKRTNIGRIFNVLSVRPTFPELDITTKIWSEPKSNTPNLQISLNHNAFLKFRSACLAAAKKLKGRG